MVTNFHEICYWSVLLEFVEILQFWLKSEKNSGPFTLRPTLISASVCKVRLMQYGEYSSEWEWFCKISCRGKWSSHFNYGKSVLEIITQKQPNAPELMAMRTFFNLLLWAWNYASISENNGGLNTADKETLNLAIDDVSYISN